MSTPAINRTLPYDANSEIASVNYNGNVSFVVHLLRIVPLLIYMRFATLLFGKILLSSHPNLAHRSIRYQRLVRRLILISALLLSLLIWLIETEFMGFFLKYVIVSPLPLAQNCNQSNQPVKKQLPTLKYFQKITPKLWILPPRILTESFVTLKLIALNSIINKYDSLANGGDYDDDTLIVGAPLGYFALELSRIEDILVEFFENCELGRSGYLLVNPIRHNTSVLLTNFQQFIGGRLHKRRDLSTHSDDLTIMCTAQAAYRSLNAKRSHSVNCIDDFRKFVATNAVAADAEYYEWARRGGGGGVVGRRRGSSVVHERAVERDY